MNMKEENINTEIPLEIPLGFPNKIIDSLLEKTVRELASGIVTTTIVNFTHKYSALAQIGIIEMGNRSNTKNSGFAKRITIWSLAVGTAAVLLSSVSVFYANKDDDADIIWQKNQLDSYNQMTLELKELNKKIDSLVIRGQAPLD